MGKNSSLCRNSGWNTKIKRTMYMRRYLHKRITILIVCFTMLVTVCSERSITEVWAAPSKAKHSENTENTKIKDEKNANKKNVNKNNAKDSNKIKDADNKSAEEAALKDKVNQADTLEENNGIDSMAVTQDQGISGGEVLNQILDSDPLLGEAPNASLPDIPHTSYQKYFRYDTTQVLKGILASGTMYFNIPEYWDTRFVYVQLEYEVSKLIKEDIPASLTILVNHVPVQSIHIYYQEGKTQLANVILPLKLLKAGYNVIEAVSYVRIFDYEGCTEDQSQANWINIEEDSYIYAGYELKDPEHKISLYPYPFVSTADPTGKTTAVMVSDNAANGELTAALYLMADLSSQTEETNEIAFGRYSEAEIQAAKNKIAVFKADNLPDALKRYIKSDMDNDSDPSKIDLSSRAMLRFVEDEAGNPMLMIVADKEANLLEAVHLLLDENRRSQEKLSLTFANENSAESAYKERLLSQLVAGSYTIKDLVGSGLTFIGPFHKEEILYLPFGKDYALSSAGKISLKFRYSENLDFNRSLITVYWGDIPIASKKLSKENTSGDELAFVVPQDIVGTSLQSIKIAFDLEIQDLFCTMRQEEMPWAYVTEDSELYLPARENSNISFDYFPSPFQSMGVFNNVLVITSDNPSDAELNLLGKTMSLYSYQTLPYGDFKVIRASEFDEADSDYNIITAGNVKSNSFLRKINNRLYFQFEEQGKAFQSSKNLILSEQYSQEVAAFELLESPYARDRAILTVCTTNEDTSKRALQFLAAKRKHTELKGDCVLIDKDLDTKSFQFIEKHNFDSRPTISQFIRENKQPVIFTIMAVAAMLLLLLSAIIILMRNKRNHREEDK